jgi:hypothetical protein
LARPAQAQQLKHYDSNTKNFWTHPPADWFLGDETEQQKGLVPDPGRPTPATMAELEANLKKIAGVLPQRPPQKRQYGPDRSGAQRSGHPRYRRLHRRVADGNAGPRRGRSAGHERDRRQARGGAPLRQLPWHKLWRSAGLAGQREEVLLKALRDYKTGARTGTGIAAMPEIAYQLGEGEMAALAHYLARLR